MDEKPPEMLYHYCSASTFLSILNSRSIRLSNLFMSNDKLEGRWANRIYEEIKDSYRISVKQMNYVDPLFQNLIVDVFGFCLSRERDVLSQWRAYADDGRGFCIGYSYNALMTLCESHSLDSVLRFDKVIYDRDVQERVVQAFMHYCEHFAFEERDIKLQILEKREFFASTEFLEGASKLYLLKNPAFEEEKEWRIISLCATSGAQNSRSYLKTHDIRYTCIGSQIKPYLSWPFDPGFFGKIRSPEIVEVVLGPKNSNEEYVIRSLMESLGLNGISILRSNASYR